MKAKIVTISLILFPALVLAQYEFRPIIDSTVACSYYRSDTRFYIQNPLYKEKKDLEFFYIVEQMPKPEIPLNEIEKMLEKEVRFNEKEMNFNGKIYFQCIVNCKGKAGDYQLIYCPAEFANICCHVLNVFRERINNWEPGKQRDTSVDVLIKTQVTVNKGNFEVVASGY